MAIKTDYTVNTQPTHTIHMVDLGTGDEVTIPTLKTVKDIAQMVVAATPYISYSFTDKVK